MENEDPRVLELNAKIAEHEENSGDAEIRDAILEKGEYLEGKGRKAEALIEYEKALLKAYSVSKKLEIIFMIMKMKFMSGEYEEVKKSIDKCKALLEEGGDWERRNKLKVYEGLYLLVIRDFSKAALLLLEALPTFNCPEIVTFNSVVFYSVVIGIITLKRAELKEKVLPYLRKVLQSSDILSSIREIPHLKCLVDSFYKCDYKQFFVSLRLPFSISWNYSANRRRHTLLNSQKVHYQTIADSSLRTIPRIL